MSTFAVLYLLDSILFKDNSAAGIVSYSLEHAQHIFKRIIGTAIDSLPPAIKEQYCRINYRSAREISFHNGSFLRVDTTLRGGAYQYVLVSEFGKTCSRNPLKAEEVVTGTLQTVPVNGTVIIESTAEGNSGFFADMIASCVERGDENLSTMEYKLFFFPWYRENGYTLDHDIEYDIDMVEYFEKLEDKNKIVLTKGQKNWYVHQAKILGEKVKQEFPSTATESLLASSDAFYFQRCIEKAYHENRVLSSNPFDSMEPVYVAMDLGVNDATVMIFFQHVHGEIRVIDFYADKDKGADFYAAFIRNNKCHYRIKTIFLPHDAKTRDGVRVENTYERDMRKFFDETHTKILVLKKTEKQLLISNAKAKFDRCVFNIQRVKPLLEQLAKYQKTWSEKSGMWLDTPLHNPASDYADSFQYAMQAVTHIEVCGTTIGAWEKHKQAVAQRPFKI
jgi:hypothetical protein